MLASSLLLLVPIPVVLVSDVFPKEEPESLAGQMARADILDLGSPERDASARDSNVSSAAHVQPNDSKFDDNPKLVGWYPRINSSEERDRLCHELLWDMVQKLGLLLPGKEWSMNTDEWPWNPNALIRIEVDKPAMREFRVRQDIHIDQIGSSEEGKILIVLASLGNNQKMLNINERQYVVIGGVIGLWTTDGQFSKFESFGANDDGISGDSFAQAPFFVSKSHFFKDQGLKGYTKVLPSVIDCFDGKKAETSYEYVIYQDVGPLDPPFDDIKYLSWSKEFVPKDYLSNAPIHERHFIVTCSIALLGFIQVWEQVIRSTHDFENPKLKEIRDKVQALGDAETEGKRKVLIKTCEFVQSILANISHPPSFISTLIACDPAIGRALFAVTRNPLNPEMKISKDVYANLSGKLLYYESQPLDFPLQLTLLCADDPNASATFGLAAIVTEEGHMVTIDAKSNAVASEMIYRVALHVSESDVQIINLPLLISNDWPLSMPGGLLIYTNGDDVRFKKTKLPAPQR